MRLVSAWTDDGGRPHEVITHTVCALWIMQGWAESLAGAAAPRNAFGSRDRKTYHGWARVFQRVRDLTRREERQTAERMARRT